MSQWAKLYKSRAWQFLRAQQLMVQPLCVMHTRLGVLEAATVVDHVKPHRGDLRLFLDPANLQSLCKYCHDSHKKRQENGGGLRGHGPDGLPVDSNHHWNS